MSEVPLYSLPRDFRTCCASCDPYIGEGGVRGQYVPTNIQFLENATFRVSIDNRWTKLFRFWQLLALLMGALRSIHRGCLPNTPRDEINLIEGAADKGLLFRAIARAKDIILASAGRLSLGVSASAGRLMTRTSGVPGGLIF